MASESGSKWRSCPSRAERVTSNCVLLGTWILVGSWPLGGGPLASPFQSVCLPPFRGSRRLARFPFAKASRRQLVMQSRVGKVKRTRRPLPGQVGEGRARWGCARASGIPSEFRESHKKLWRKRFAETTKYIFKAQVTPLCIFSPFPGHGQRRPGSP